MKIKFTSLLLVAIAVASVLGKAHHHISPLGFFQG
jgi:hypothetical protein